MRLLSKEVTKEGVTGVTGVTVTPSPVNTGLSEVSERLHLKSPPGVTGVTESNHPNPLAQAVTPVTPSLNSGVTAKELAEAAPAVVYSDELHRLHQLHLKNDEPENVIDETEVKVVEPLPFNTLMTQVAIKLGRSIVTVKPNASSHPTFIPLF